MRPPRLAGDRDPAIHGEGHAGLQHGLVALLQLGRLQIGDADRSAGAIARLESGAAVDLVRRRRDILGDHPFADAGERRLLRLDGGFCTCAASSLTSPMKNMRSKPSR